MPGTGFSIRLWSLDQANKDNEPAQPPAAPPGEGGASVPPRGRPDMPPVKEEGSSLEKLPDEGVAANPAMVPYVIRYLNLNAERIKSLECRDVALRYSHNSQTVHLDAALAFQKPHNLRLVGKLLGEKNLDFGCKDRECWFWFKKMEPPYLFRFSSNAAGDIAPAVFRSQRDWLLEALGLAEYDRDKTYQMTKHGGTIELVEPVELPPRRPGRKVTILDRRRGQLVVTAHLAQDAEGKTLCATYLSEYDKDPESGAMIPLKIQVELPTLRTMVELTLGKVKVNRPIDTSRAAQLFDMPQMDGVRVFDLNPGRGASGPGDP